MTILNKRQSEIIDYLSAENDWIAANRIAESFAISVSTLRRDIEVINTSLGDQNSLIKSKPGLGLRYDGGSPFNRGHVSASGIEGEIFTTKRLVGIATDLLTQSPQPISISALAEKYYVSRSSIVEDLKKVELWVAGFALTMVKDHSGTHLCGDDLNIRMALKEIITNSVFSHYQMVDSRIDRFSRTKLVDQFGKVNVENCTSLIGFIESELSIAISEPYYTNLFSHLLVTIQRVSGLAEQPTITSFQQHSCKEWMIAEKAVAWLEQEYNLRLPEIEVSYIYQYIISSGHHVLKADAGSSLPQHSEADKYASRFIDVCSQELGLNLSLDTKLRRDLAQHIKPMLNRLAYGIAIHNPLLEDIKSEFGRAFESARCATKILSVKYDYPTTSDDEIAYLTLYIQTALEKFSACKKIIIVCSSGVGTSQLLASRINRAFPEWEIVDIVPGSQLSATLGIKNCDLIVSTIKLEGVELPIAYVSALFSKKDNEKVSEKIISAENIKENDDAR